MKTLTYLILLLSFSSAFAGKIQVGQTVYGNNNDLDLVGTVNAIYGEKAEVLWTLRNGVPYDFGRVYYWPCESLSESVHCYKGLCNEDVVYGNNGNELIGKVTNIFANGTIEIKWMKINGSNYNFSFLSYWQRDQVTKKVSSCKTCH